MFVKGELNKGEWNLTHHRGQVTRVEPAVAGCFHDGFNG